MNIYSGTPLARTTPSSGQKEVLFAQLLHPCTPSVQDLNRLTCFCNFWNRGIWRFCFVVVHEDQGLFVNWGWGWYFRDTDCPSCHPL